MRIVAIADTHSNHQNLDPLPDGDVLVHAGDLTRSGRHEELAVVAKWLIAQQHRHKVVIAGNHDWCFARDRPRAVAVLGDDVHYLEDQAVVLERLRLYGSPWQPEFCEWAFNLRRGPALAERWAAIPEGLDVLVTHGPPRGFGDRVGGERVGCDDLLRALGRARPRVHLFGHIHEDGGTWRHEGIQIANVTTREGERGATILDVDVDARTVVMVDVPASRSRQPRRGKKNRRRLD